MQGGRGFGGVGGVKGVVGDEEIFVGDVGAVGDDFAVHEGVVPGDVDVVPFVVDFYLVPGVGLDAGAVVGCAVDELFFQAGFLAEVGEGFGITFTDGGVEEEGAFGGEGAVGKGVGGQVVIIVVYVDDEVVVEGFDFFVIRHGGGIKGVCKSGHFFVFFGGYRKEVW